MCITKNVQIYCAFCGIPSKQDLSEAHESTIKKLEMRNNYPELFNETSERFKESFQEFKGLNI
jgi:hypothetical protein